MPKLKTLGIRPGEKIHELMINEAEIPRTYQFGNMFVINSSIAEYQHVQTAEYAVEENKISEEAMPVLLLKRCRNFKGRSQRIIHFIGVA